MKRFARASLVLAVAGCAMSSQSFERLGEAVSNRNERARADAEAVLAKQGYRFPTDDELYLSLENAAREICERREYEGKDPPLTLHVSTAATAHRPAPPAVAVSAPASAACAFFAEAGRSELFVLRDGARERLVRIPPAAMLARAPSGELVFVVDRSRATTRRVRVDRTCNRMPSAERAPEGPLPASIRVRWSTGEAKPPAEVPLVYDREALDVECTRNVY